MASACAGSINSECWADGLGFETISTTEPGTFASISALSVSRGVLGGESDVDEGGVPYLGVLRWLKIVRAEFWDEELAGLGGVEVAGARGAGEGLVVDDFL